MSGGDIEKLQKERPNVVRRKARFRRVQLVRGGTSPTKSMISQKMTAGGLSGISRTYKGVQWYLTNLVTQDFSETQKRWRRPSKLLMGTGAKTDILGLIPQNIVSGG
jgi:hypothetical protein